MAAGVILVIFQLGRELFDARAGLFAALAAGLMAPFVYYAKLANVEVPYLLWLALSLLFYVRILARHRLRDYIWFAVTAALAIGTKDQAYGFYLGLPLAIAVSDMRFRREGGVASFWRGLFNRRTFATLGTGAAVLALGHNLLFNWEGAIERVRIMTGPITLELQEFPNTLAGHAAMLALAGRHLQFTFGWPLCLAALVGIVMVMARWRWHARACALLVPIVSYWIFLIVPIMYHYDRYLLGVALVLSVFAGFALSEWSRARRVPASLRHAVLAAVVGYSTMYAASVDLLMAFDARVTAERWIQAHIAEGRRVMAVGYDMYLPRFGKLDVVYTARPTLDQLEAHAPDYLVFTSIFEDWRFREEPASLAFLHAVRSGRTPYALSSVHRGRPPLNLLNLNGVRTNLDKINPRIQIYERLGHDASEMTSAPR
jgi:4-amino-4-deoxy-L-arabinose transferase-like glycosyltransferase